MRILAVLKIISAVIMVYFSTSKVNAQKQNCAFNQDQKFEQLLNEKRKMNASPTLNDAYKFQIFNGSSENAKKILSEFKQEFEAIEATIVFNTPNYKVWVGNFRTRIEAERNLVAIKDRYKNVLLIKPSR
jgi:hypothetical protein